MGYIMPFTTTANVLVRELWTQESGWTDPLLAKLAQKWKECEGELPLLHQITLNRSYFPPTVDLKNRSSHLHVFCDASEVAYGSVDYLHAKDGEGQVHLTYVPVRSTVASKKHVWSSAQHSRVRS